MIYQFRTGKTFRGVDAQTAGEELERIRNASGGKLATQEVVRWAAEPDSPLHACFTWDNEKAAQEFRLEEARSLIRSVVVVKNDDDKPQPAFWNVAIATPRPDSDPVVEQYYQSAAVIQESPREFAAALRLMLRELAAAERGLEQLRLLAPRGTKMKIDRATGQVKSAQRELTDLVPAK